MGEAALKMTPEDLEEDYDDSWYEDEVWRPESEVEEEPIVLERARDKLPEIPKILPSQFTSGVFQMPKPDGTGYAPFSFEGRRHLQRIYDTPARKVLMCCGRQVEKSTLLGNLSLAYMTLVVGLRILFVSPSSTQTKTFSNDRIKEPIETSPLLTRFTTSMLTKNIFEKQFVNRSMITMRYAYLNADRTRGIPAWQLFLDEIQDILRDNIPVIEHCLSHAPEMWRRQVYSGTPKSLDNIIEDYRANQSTQGEWVVPCEGCRHWNVLGEKNIGKKGVICAKCGKPIDPQGPRAQWAWMVKPDPTDPNKVPWESYRIPQLMVPWKLSEEGWAEVLYGYENYPRAKFMNETLGISFESGMRPITTAQMRDACGEHSMNDLETVRTLSLSQPFFMGVDWGTGDNAYTVCVIATYVENRFRVLFAHRFVGEESDPNVQLKKLVDLGRHFNIAIFGCDYGFGFGMNHHLVRAFGAPRVMKYQYMGQLAKKVLWDEKMQRWKAHRTEVMSAIFEAIKKKKCEFPKWEEFKAPYAKDFTNIYSEYNERLRIVQYDHKPGNPDDTFHAFTYAWLASMIVIPRPDIISPSKEDEDGRPISPYSGPVDQG
jgi:hypothetical protein